MDELVKIEEEAKSIQEIFEADTMRTKRGIQAFSNYVDSLPDALGENPFELFHDFADGIYTREIHLPKGFVLVGKLHKHEAMVMMLKGKVLVADIDGVRMVEAPCQFVSKPGIKRVGYVLEDVVWIDIHHTEATTIEDAEAELFETNYSEFELLCEELGYTPEQVREISENTGDMISIDNDGVYIADSDIEGKGVFATKDYKAGETVGVSRIQFDRTELGRYTNHSFKNNAKCVVMNKSIFFVANREIKKDEEITVDYREAREKALELDKMLENTQITGWSSCQA